MSDQMQSEIAQLNRTFEELEDPRKCFALLQERMRQYRAAGWSIPEDMKLLERRIMNECLAESQGR
jgi:hypothetical protein